MLRSNRLARLGGRLGPVLCAFTLATPAFAGMTQDLADCTAADRKTSAEACTRVMNSGRLPKSQSYIGYYNRGWSHFNAGAYDKAVADFDKSIGYNPGYADTYMSRAQALHEQNERERSLADLDTYLEKKGEVADAHVNRARLFRRRGELDRSFSELQRAASLEPDNSDVLVLRALVLSDLGEKAPARAEADKAVAAKPDDPTALYARAVTAFREDLLEAASADVDKALSKKDAFPASHALKGEISERRNESNAAIASYRRALEFSPRSLDGRMAHEKARARLSALTGTPLAPAEVVQAAAAPSAPPSTKSDAAQGPDCRRFIPSAGTTVAVKCD